MESDIDDKDCRGDTDAVVENNQDGALLWPQRVLRDGRDITETIWSELVLLNRLMKQLKLSINVSCIKHCYVNVLLSVSYIWIIMMKRMLCVIKFVVCHTLYMLWIIISYALLSFLCVLHYIFCLLYIIFCAIYGALYCWIIWCVELYGCWIKNRVVELYGVLYDYGCVIWFIELYGFGALHWSIKNSWRTWHKLDLYALISPMIIALCVLHCLGIFTNCLVLQSHNKIDLCVGSQYYL